MASKGTRLEPDQEDGLQDLPSDSDPEPAEGTIYETLEIYGQTPDSLIYWNDPEFQELLVRFQHAEWDQCLEIIDKFRITYPDDKFLVVFRRDIDVRKRLQAVRQQRLTAEKRERLRKTGMRVHSMIIVALLTLLLVFWANNAYQANLEQARRDYEATLLAQSLAANYQNADSFMKAGRPQEALDLFLEIQQVDPLYKDVDTKIQDAKEALAVESLYQQGLQAMQANQTDAALSAFRQLEAMRPKYKDTLQLIQNLETDKQVALLVKEIYAAYAREDWAGVVDASEAIRELEPFFENPELKEILFVSYQNMVVDIAGRDDATLTDIEKAERYYRFALALFPQDKTFTAERGELQEVAIELLANKYYLYGISLLESSNYSYLGTKEAIRILNKANGIESGSPVIQTEIDKAQLFLNGYEALLRRDWAGALTTLGELYRKEEDYAGGRLRYLLYEAYTAHGDALFAFADFEGASLDYQEAEKFSWHEEGNALRLFQIEVRLAAVLRKLWRVEESVEFYRYAFDQLGYKTRLSASGNSDILDALNKAEQAYRSGDAWEAVRFYEMALEEQEKLYDYETIMVSRGDTLFNVAFRYGCTVEILRTANQLGESMMFTKDQDILVPIAPSNP